MQNAVAAPLFFVVRNAMLLLWHKNRSFLVEAVCILLMQTCFVPIIVTISTTNAALRQVHVITRHGSRRPLPKSASTLDDTSESKSSFSTGVNLQNVIYYQ